jgi:hypothetical protein
MSCEYSRFVREKATSGMSSDQIAAGYAEQWGISYELAKQRMAEPKYQQEIEAGRMSGLGMIWAKLYTLAVDKNDHGILLLLAKERLNLFGKVDSEELLAKSSLSKEQLKAAHDIIFAK